ncbi:MAG: hypothetical protein AAGI10_11300 [Pseudomonadota bacterium]
MFRLFRNLILLALAFAAGVQFERADAGTTCGEEAEWAGYLQCVGREIMSEVLS